MGNGNVLPGTVVDTGIAHPVYYDWYMVGHGGIKGTSKPTRYVMLLDQVGCT